MRSSTHGSADALLELVYEELHHVAEQWVSREPRAHALDATMLVHETYLRMRNQRARWRSRTHYLAVATTVMRRILIDHARRCRGAVRGGAWRRVALSKVADGSVGSGSDDFEALCGALRRLESLNQRQARVIELRFMAGLSVDATAAVLGVASRTVKLDWRTARAWLVRELGAHV